MKRTVRILLAVLVLVSALANAAPQSASFDGPGGGMPDCDPTVQTCPK